ncbi:MAG: CBS domain-containing protein [Methanoregulaceae archaeon]|nr:CBS domain-containing protein [Methanoregulaceae archaeon]
MQVKEAMTPDPVTCQVHDKVRVAAGLMRKNRIGGLPVLDGTTLVGIITDSDIISLLDTGRISDDLWLPSPLEIIEVPIRELVNWEKTRHALTNIGDTEVRKVMSSPPITADAEMEIEEAASLMLHRKITRLPVLDKGRLVGIITRADVVNAVGAAHTAEGGGQ